MDWNKLTPQQQAVYVATHIAQHNVLPIDAFDFEENWNAWKTHCMQTWTSSMFNQYKDPQKIIQEKGPDFKVLYDDCLSETRKKRLSFPEHEIPGALNGINASSANPYLV